MLACAFMPLTEKHALRFATLTLDRPASAATKDREAERVGPPQGFRFGHILELDGFRGLAVLLVTAGHFLEYHLRGRNGNTLSLALGQTGVLLFFVLSGFLITGLLQREREATGRIGFRNFYVRRALRLLPALAVLLASVAVLVQLRQVTDVTRTEFLACLFYARNLFGHSTTLGHIWSLSLEEQFYLLWPLTLALLPRKDAAMKTLAVCTGFMIWRGLAISANLFPYERGIYYVRPYFRFDSILIGAFVALWFASSEPGREQARRILRLAPTFALWVALALWAYFGEMVSRPLHTTLLEILAAAALAEAVLCPDKWTSRILRSRALRFFGMISYSLYLWQQLFTMADQPSWGIWRQFPLALVAPVALATISYFALERPALRLKERLAPQVTPP